MTYCQMEVDGVKFLFWDIQSDFSQNILPNGVDCKYGHMPSLSCSLVHNLYDFAGFIIKDRDSLLSHWIWTDLWLILDNTEYGNHRV
jgi:hypothetical protein